MRGRKKHPFSCLTRLTGERWLPHVRPQKYGWPLIESLGVLPVEDEVSRLNLLKCRLIARESA
ncbi:hypothetical protein GIW15_11880 [Pseudomonas lurida]|nr:hypothetical protein [Pseudomonas lurida]MCF5309604.1 hypothetical protein [Pseudomonas lurida]MCF5324666.1 hypothetical protein [Pseudomonas lurida]